MDRRNRVWLILLAVLLVAAIAGVIFVNRQLAESKQTLAVLNTEFDDVNAQLEEARQAGEDAQAQLTQAQTQSEKLQAELDDALMQSEDYQAQLSEAQSHSEELEAQLNKAQTESEDLQVQLEAAREDQKSLIESQQVSEEAIATLEGEVQAYEKQVAELEEDAARAENRIIDLTRELEKMQTAEGEAEPASDQNVATSEPEQEATARQTDNLSSEEDAGSQQNPAEMELQLEQAQAHAEELSAALTKSEETIATLEEELEDLRNQHQSDSADAEARIEELNAQIEKEKLNAQELGDRVQEARDQLDHLYAELAVYKMERELGEGEAYSAATLENEIVVAAGEAAAHWQYVNDARSGNEVILSIELDGEEIYRSASLLPGEMLENFQFDRVLESGKYEAVAVTRIYDEAGELRSTTRMPVVINVK